MAPSWTSMRRRRPPVQHGEECRSRPRPPFRKLGQLHQRRRHGRRNASVSSPETGVRPSLLGPPPSVGRWRRQHIGADSRPRRLRRRGDNTRPSQNLHHLCSRSLFFCPQGLTGGASAMVGWHSNGCVLWLFWGCVVVRAGMKKPKSLATYVTCTKCVQVSLNLRIPT